MDISTEIIISTIAATLTTVSFLPQAVKVLITRQTEALSFWMYLLFTIGVSFWLIYGLLILSYPLIISNIITFILSVIILIIKIINFYKK